MRNTMLAVVCSVSAFVIFNMIAMIFQWMCWNYYNDLPKWVVELEDKQGWVFLIPTLWVILASLVIFIVIHIVDKRVND